MAKKTRKPREGLSRPEQDFCKAYVENGGKATEAIATAMPHTRTWKPQSRSEKASRLLALDKVQARIAELAEIMRQKANAEFAMSAEEIIYRLTLMGRANLHAYMELDEKGQPSIAFKNTDEGQFYALAEVTVEDIESGRRHGKRTKVKLPDRIAALKLLGTLLGMFSADIKLNGGQPIPVVLSSAETRL